MNSSSGLVSNALWGRPVVAAVFLLSVLAALLGSLWAQPALFFLPAALLAIPILATRFLRDPIPLLALYVLVVASLSNIPIGGGLSPDVALSAGLLWALLVRGHLEGRGVGRSPIELAMLLYLVVVGVSVLLSVDPATSIKRYGRDLQYFVLFSFLFHRRMSGKEERGLILAVLLASVIPCLAGFLGKAGVPYFTGANLNSLESADLVARVRGTMAHPVILAIFNGLIGVILLSFILTPRYLARSITIPLFVLNLTIMYLTFGRSGWAGFFIAVPVLLWITGRRKLLFIGTPFVFAAILKALPRLQERLVSTASVDESNSLLWRLELWRAALEKFPDKPIFGSGPSTFLEYVAFRKGYSPHQTWVGRLVETGSLGTLAFLVLVLVVGWQIRAALRSFGREGDPLLQGVYAAYFGLMFTSLGSAVWSIPSVVIYFWVMLVIAIHPDRLARVRASRDLSSP